MKTLKLLMSCLAFFGTQAHASPPKEPVSAINGQTPPGRVAPLEGITVLLDTVTPDGKRLLVERGTRLAGTRVAIHEHDFGGYTCVLSGEITDFVEGQPSKTYPAGSCYYMPPQTPMTAANLGDVDAVLIDNFRVPPGAPAMRILEPGYLPATPPSP